ncbi:MAG: FG-GAP-like repeat-containing protein [Saprospiraceae bacterium]
MYKAVLLIACLALGGGLRAQIQFVNASHLLGSEPNFSGVAMGVCDVNGDGQDDIVRFDGNSLLQVLYQTGTGGAFLRQDLGFFSEPWGLCIGDVRNNGYPDLLFGGSYNDIQTLLNNAGGFQAQFQNAQAVAPQTFVQCVNFVDINNDGYLDAFVCHDDGASRVLINNHNGQLIHSPSQIDLSTVPASDNSGNYGSVWSDVNGDGLPDLYIAKCRQGVNSTNDGRRINQLYINKGGGVFEQDVTNASGLRIGAQSWTADFGDIDNDGDMDCFVTNHDGPCMLLVNDGTGVFTDISMASGIATLSLGLPIQGLFRDFDNDGHLDIFVAGTEHFVLRNNGDLTFSPVVGLFDGPQIESCALGDLNGDGFVDIYAGYGDLYNTPNSSRPDKLWLNVGNDNGFAVLRLEGVQSNRNAIGAIAKLYTPAGIQMREVRAGESYGISNSHHLHFGLGQQTSVDSVVILWPSGQKDTHLNPPVNRYLYAKEGGCLTPYVKIESEGPTVFCLGESVTLQGPADQGFYLWSNGAGAQNVEVADQGFYFLRSGANADCLSYSNVLEVKVNPDETPQISFVEGGETFCAGSGPLLASSPAQEYLWSTGETTQQIVANASGLYFVTIKGLCDNYTSLPVELTAVEAAAPEVKNDTVKVGESALLTAIGDSIRWYDAPGGALVGLGPIFKTEEIAATETYWATNTMVLDIPNEFVGKTAHAGTNFNASSTNGGLIFDCYRPVRLHKVLVYSPVAAVRRIVLLDQNDNELQGVSVNIPAGTSVVTLDIDLPVADNLTLTTDVAVNQANLGVQSPRLRRSDQGVNFPYTLPDYIQIKNSTFGSAFYYYFYNWEIDFPELVCESEAVPVRAVVDSSLSLPPRLAPRVSLTLSPNPASEVLQIRASELPAGLWRWSICDARGILRMQNRGLGSANGDFWAEIDVRGLPAGVYVLRWEDDRGTAALRWVKL